MCLLDTISTSLLVVMRTWYKPFCMVREEKHLRQARIWIPFTLEPQSSCHRLCHMRKKKYTPVLFKTLLFKGSLLLNQILPQKSINSNYYLLSSPMCLHTHTCSVLEPSTDTQELVKAFVAGGDRYTLLTSLLPAAWGTSSQVCKIKLSHRAFEVPEDT